MVSWCPWIPSDSPCHAVLIDAENANAANVGGLMARIGGSLGRPTLRRPGTTCTAEIFPTSDYTDCHIYCIRARVPRCGVCCAPDSANVSRLNARNMIPPLFHRTNRLGHILLLGERVEVFATQTDPHLNAPSLYEFSVWSGSGNLHSVYIGQASQGIGRPLEQYQKIIANLRENRRRGIRRDEVTNWPYKSKNPWGFRWVHHELESVLHKNAQIPSFKVELCVNPLTAGLTKSELNKAESQAIAAWKGIDDAECINGRPSIIMAEPSSLDEAWCNAV